MWVNLWFCSHFAKFPSNREHKITTNGCITTLINGIIKSISIKAYVLVQQIISGNSKTKVFFFKKLFGDISVQYKSLKIFIERLCRLRISITSVRSYLNLTGQIYIEPRISAHAPSVIVEFRLQR